MSQNASKYFSSVDKDVFIRPYRCLPNGGYVFRNHYAVVAGRIYIYVCVCVCVCVSQWLKHKSRSITYLLKIKNQYRKEVYIFPAATRQWFFKP